MKEERTSFSSSSILPQIHKNPTPQKKQEDEMTALLLQAFF